MISDIRRKIVSGVNQRFFYGWAVVGVTSLGIFASGPGQSHTFSVFVEPIGRDLDISSTEIAGAYGIATLGAAFLLPKIGTLVDRFGPRRMLLIIAALLGLACLFFGAAAGVLWLAVGFAMLRFLGQGSMMLGCANMVSQWFSRGRGLAMSLMALGFGVSMAVHPPLSQFLVEEIGWRQAWVVLGALTWALMLPPLLLLAHDAPEPLGLRPDGQAPEAGEDTAAAKAIFGLSLKEALRQPTFYILLLGWCALTMLATALHFYQVTLLTARGLSAEFAAGLFTVSAVTMVAAMPLVGRMLDKIRTRFVFAGGLFIQAVALVLITTATDEATAAIYAVTFGLNNAFNMTMFGYLWPRYFGRRHVGSIQGTGQMMGVIAASLGPIPVGLALDYFGTATPTLRLLALYPLAAGIVALLFLRTPRGVEGVAHLE